jgi:hypothetical protein
MDCHEPRFQKQEKIRQKTKQKGLGESPQVLAFF